MQSIDDFNLGNIQIGGKNYPICCDMRVLAEIQESYPGTIPQFEMDMIGLDYVRDDDGVIQFEKDKDGISRAKKTLGAPKVRTLMLALELMLREGINLYNVQHAGDPDRIDYGAPEATASTLAVICRIPYTDLAQILHAEFSKCFGAETVKKKEPKKRTRTQQPT